MRNELTVQFKRDFVEGYDCLWTELVVDGTPIVDFKRYTLDWGVFASHYLETGEYFLVTCTCGVLGCANLREGVLIRDDGHSIHWVVRTTKPTQVFRFEREGKREVRLDVVLVSRGHLIGAQCRRQSRGWRQYGFVNGRGEW